MRLALLALATTFALPGLLRAADDYQIDVTHAHATFVINHLGFSNTWGRFNGIGGTITWDAANPTASAVKVTITTDSIDTGTAKKDEHLRSPDFLSVKEFPEMTFVSKAFEAKGNNVYHVTGDFSLRGVTKSITVPVTFNQAGKDPWGKDRIGFETEFTIKRSDYGMTHMLGGIGDDVRIIFSVEGVR